MKIIKKLKATLMILFITTLAFASLSYATTDSTGKMLGLYDALGSANTGNGRPTGFYTTGREKGNPMPVIKIIEYNSEGTAADSSKATQTIYCLKDGRGFGSPGSSGKIVKYNEYFDLKNPSSITPEAYRSALPEGQNYNKLIWLLDNICIPENEASVNKLLKAAGAEDIRDYITKEDELKDVLEVIQQTAIWYITNANDDYKPTQSLTINYSKDNGGSSENLEDKYGLDLGNNPLENIYNYLIEGAEEHATYSFAPNTSSSSNPINLETSRATTKIVNGKFLIGPYKLTINNNNYTNFSAKVFNGTAEIGNVDVVNESQSAYQGDNTQSKILDSQGKDFYISLPTTTSATQIKVQVTAQTEVTNLEYWSTPVNQVQTSQPVVIVKKENKNINFEDSKSIEKPKFDLALRKFIEQIDGKKVTPSREPEITQESLLALASGSSSALDNGTTARKTHIKNALPVKNGSRIIYTIRIYNEGEIDGYAEEITDYLPEGLKLVPAEQSSINAMYRWTEDNGNSRIIKTTYLSQQNNANDNLLHAFNKSPVNGQYTISYKDVQVECEVTASTQSTDTHLKNVAEITKDSNSANITDRDSVTNDLQDGQKNNYAPGTSTQGKGYQDDDDYEDLVLLGKYFDLALRKYITAVNGTELKTGDTFDREPVVDVNPLLNGNTTASYKHTKVPVSVSVGDVVTYTIRIYNEGQVDGYADEIVDHLPPELEFLPDDELNQKYLWTIDSSDRTQRTIRTAYLSKNRDEDNIIAGFKQEGTTLDYKEIQIRCKVSMSAPSLKKLTNIAEITASSNEFDLTDRDNEKNATLPQDANLPDYKGNDDNQDDLSSKDYFYKGQEDDDDFEKVILEKFDLALRKFITGVNDETITSRIPQVDTSKYGTVVDGKEITDMEYNHTKEPVRVANNDIVIYTIRVYNEGTKSGYASEIKDDIPDGLEFIPDHEINTKYKWVLYDENGEITTDAQNAVSMKTDYLSKQNESEDGEYLLKAYDRETMSTPDYRDVQIAFLVTEPNTSDRILTNHAEISEDTDEDGNPVDDIDSTPDEWIDEDDDQDVEHVYVKYFDLALRKWVSQVILIEDGVQKEMDTGHYAEQDPEPAVKVELNKKRIENTIVKFRYQIRITNEGEIEGYATEISDYIPEGLRFNQADNPKWKEVNGKIVTDQLKDTLLQPGESATVEVVLTWINSEDNLDLKTNVAEISEDDNPHGADDIDSIPNNKKKGEDDIDDAPVILTVVTGLEPTHIAIIAGTILIVGAGAFIIKKFVI